MAISFRSLSGPRLDLREPLTFQTIRNLGETILPAYAHLGAPIRGKIRVSRSSRGHIHRKMEAAAAGGG